MLDKLETEEYKIIVDDAAKWLKTFKEEKKQFDVIFGDLTDIPVHQRDSTWAWVRSILKLALYLLPLGEFVFTFVLIFLLFLWIKLYHIEFVFVADYTALTTNH